MTETGEFYLQEKRITEDQATHYHNRYIFLEHINGFYPPGDCQDKNL